MEEELNEEEHEGRHYTMPYNADETEKNAEQNKQHDSLSALTNITAPRNTVYRYWKTNVDYQTTNTPYRKVNIPKKDINIPQNIKSNDTTVAKPKEEKCEQESDIKVNNIDLSVFETTSDAIKVTVKVLDNDDGPPIVDLEASDDEVVEVALPPKPTITIESSDEDEITIITPQHSLETSQKNPSTDSKEVQNKNGKRPADDREVSASPVPSVVSSVSDDFIRGDCIALNISSRHPENHSFNFNLHGSDLLGTPSRKKKKKKDPTTSTPIVNNTTPDKTTVNTKKELFATPKNKSKNKRQRTNSYAVNEQSIPNADVYDSDSNQSLDNNKKPKTYSVNEKSLPNVDVYESDSSQSEIIKKSNKNQKEKDSKEVDSSDSSISLSQSHDEPVCLNIVTSNISTTTAVEKSKNCVMPDIIDLDLLDDCPLNEVNIEENIIMANVTGFKESNDYGDNNQLTTCNERKLGSTKIPEILSADLDFDNLKGNEKICKKRRYSLSALRVEMEKFYNESWGGEEFNHCEILKTMSRDKSLWEIDPKDRMPTPYKKKTMCYHCNRPGHRNDTCRLRTPVCHMCGSIGHYEPHCPSKICVNCGSPNYIYSTICRNCSGWSRITCVECRQVGHPASHCPDVWRRYHNTISNDMPLVETRRLRKHSQQYCSGCARRGHMVHTCRNFIPFCGMPVNSPYVASYRAIYPPASNQKENTPITTIFHTKTYNQIKDQRRSLPEESIFTSKFTMSPKVLDLYKRQSSPTYDIAPRNDFQKRHSTSPMHENHVPKKRHISLTENAEDKQPTAKKPTVDSSECELMGTNTSKSVVDECKKNPDNTVTVPSNVEAAPDFIPLFSSNRDKKGQIIQDNEVSDTSDVITSARIYVTNDMLEKLKSKEGASWLQEKSQSCNVVVTHSDINSFLTIKGKVGDQETFQSDLRDWANQFKTNQEKKDNSQQANENDPSNLSNNIPKNRNNVLRILNKAFISLKQYMGDPKQMFKELNYLQSNHQKLLSQKVISPKKLSNSTDNIKGMMRKLNIALLGQAGLADGPEHLKELYSLQKKLSAYRNKTITLDLRKEIGEHYHSIFTGLPRDDYSDLVDKFYMTKGTKTVKRKKKAFKLDAKPIDKNSNSNLKVDQPTGDQNFTAQAAKTTRQRRKLINKLTFYQKKIMSTRPINAVFKKTREQLLQQLHVQISLLGNQEKVTSNTLKKLRKIKAHATLFLTNNYV